MPTSSTKVSPLTSKFWTSVKSPSRFRLVTTGRVTGSPMTVTREAAVLLVVIVCDP